jgi:hypothetical protein
MQLVSTEDFLQRIHEIGLGFDPAFPSYLRLQTSGESTRFWLLPYDPATWIHFIWMFLKRIDEWHSGYLWPREGTWPEGKDYMNPYGRVREVLFQGTGIPAGWNGAVHFDHSEIEKVTAALYVFLVFGWHGADDIFSSRIMVDKFFGRITTMSYMSNVAAKSECLNSLLLWPRRAMSYQRSFRTGLSNARRGCQKSL